MAFRLTNVPKVTLGQSGVTSRTGSGVPLPAIQAQTVKSPGIKALGTPKIRSSAVPSASGQNLGTKVNPVSKTTPSASHGGSLVG